MENLAGRQDCDPIIRKELTRASIDILELPFPMQSEVPASVIGQLPRFIFHRAWYYWVVQGQVPLDVARKLYEDPNGREDIRVAGNAGCPSPEEWVEHYDKSGMKLKPLTAEPSLIEIESRVGSSYIEFAAEVRRTTRFVEDPVKEAVKSIISSYHIDTQAGLNFFVATLRENGIIPPKVKTE